MNVTLWLNANRNLLGWILCAGALVGVFVLAFTCEKPMDLTILVPAILGVYVSGEAAKRVGTVMAAARDPSADLESIVRVVSGREKPVPSEPAQASRVDSPAE